jgi:starvation-inducible DNA-binding protein
MTSHKFFEGQYDQIDEMIDEIAERVRALGKTPIATLGEFLKVAR